MSVKNNHRYFDFALFMQIYKNKSLIRVSIDDWLDFFYFINKYSIFYQVFSFNGPPGKVHSVALVIKYVITLSTRKRNIYTVTLFKLGTGMYKTLIPSSITPFIFSIS